MLCAKEPGFYHEVFSVSLSAEVRQLNTCFGSMEVKVQVDCMFGISLKTGVYC